MDGPNKPQRAVEQLYDNCSSTMRRHLLALSPLSASVTVTNQRRMRRSIAVDRCTLEITYCNTQLHWDIVYNHQDPSQAPDVILDAGHDSFITCGEVASFRKWDASADTALCDLIAELLAAFRKHQRQLVRDIAETHQAFSFDLGQAVDAADTDLLVEQQRNGAVVVRVAVPVSLDGTAVPLKKGEDEDDRARIIDQLHAFKPVFHVAFSVSNASSKPEIALVLRPEAPDWLKVSSPTWKDGDLYTLANDMGETLINKLATRTSTLGERQLLQQALVEVFGPPLEFDAVHFSSAAFAVDFGSHSPAILHLQIPDTANPQPFLTVYSGLALSSSKSGGLLQPSAVHLQQTYAFSPRWSPDELAGRIKDYVINNANDWQVRMGVV